MNQRPLSFSPPSTPLPVALVDSHCHLDFPEFHGRELELLEAMEACGVKQGLVVGVTLERFPAIIALADRFENLFASVGVHPDTDDHGAIDPSVEDLVALSAHPKVVAIGETGLDYYRLTGDLEWQRDRFRNHIRAARQVNKPLIIHTRAASADTLQLLREEQGETIGGVFHCFTETREVALAALELGFHISFSGIVTFKNAAELREIVPLVPDEKLLIETDAPYLAPVPYRGKLNHPALVLHVAEEVARLRGVSLEHIAHVTTRNFNRLFLNQNHE